MDHLGPLGPLRHAHVGDLDRLLLVGRQVHLPRAQDAQEVVPTLLTAMDEITNIIKLSILSLFLPDGEVSLHALVDDGVAEGVCGTGGAVELDLRGGVQLEGDGVVAVDVLGVAVREAVTGEEQWRFENICHSG